MNQRTTAREVAWMLSGMVLLFNCWCLVAYLLIGMFGITFTGLLVFLVGCVFGAIGAGLGLGVSMHLEHVRWGLKMKSEQAAGQLLNTYLPREILVIIGIWVISPAVNMAALVLLMALSGDSL